MSFHRVYPFNYTDLIRFVEQADDAYILTHATTNIMHFSKFATGGVCNELIEFLYRNPPKMFGTKKQRVRKWYVMSIDEKAVTLKKHITHKQVKVKRGIKIKLGDDLVEYWTLAYASGSFKITSIQADSELEKEV